MASKDAIGNIARVESVAGLGSMGAEFPHGTGLQARGLRLKGFKSACTQLGFEKHSGLNDKSMSPRVHRDPNMRAFQECRQPSAIHS